MAAFVSTGAFRRGVLASPSVCTAPSPRMYRRSAVAKMAVSGAVDAGQVKSDTVGEEGTFDFRVIFKSGDKQLSPWHDIPLYANEEKTLLNFVNEIPKGTAAKMEIATDETLNPIKQDIKKGALRFYKYSDSVVNYGALPQTWEDPNEKHPDTGCGGDNDPVDVIEISPEPKPMGSVYPVKPFGILALIDDGETDWKVLAIDASHPAAEKINSVEDAKAVIPGIVEEATEWFKMYKTAEGKGENEYAFGGEPKDLEYTMKVVAETNESYLKLKAGQIPNEDLALN